MWKQVVVFLCLALAVSEALKYYDANEWIKIADAADNDRISLIVAVKQRNIAELERIFWEVSTPSSPRYGKFLTKKQVHELVRPSEESIDTVVAWLAQNGVKVDHFSGSKDFVHAFTTASIASRMLNTKYEVFRHFTTGQEVIKSTQTYQVPDHVQPHIDFVAGHIAFPLSVKPLYFAPTADGAVTPDTLRERYNVTTALLGSNTNNSFSVAEFQAQYYSPSDLTEFFKQFVTFAPKDSVVNKVIGQNDGSNPGVEANLDIQYIKGVAPGVSTWFWSNPAMDFFTDMVNWLSQIDSTAEAPWIQSVSYGSQDQWPTQDVHDRVDKEFQKSGVRGISIIFASGDSGTGCLTCVKFRPSWPASSQYVTSVGATSFINGKSGDEQAVDAFGSGGGFSTADAQPSYQKDAVAHYFQVQKDLPASFYYDPSGRATPDVAALGIGFQVVDGGRVISVGGTSASCPTFAGIVSLLNDIRLNNKKPTLGFLNPWLYSIQAKNAFFDVTVGNNRHGCCGLTGFKAAPGWDPVTGLGTPNFDVLRTLV